MFQLGFAYPRDKEQRMVRFGPPELIILLIIVILLFGVGRIGKIAGEFGKGIRAFREGIAGDGADAHQPETEKQD
jgi:sec-independent protein translocase protein TatA